MIGKNYLYFDSITSTNNYAMELVHNGNAQHGSIVHAAHQTQGKGQRGKTWIDEPNQNLCFSLILNLNLPIQYSFYISKWISTSLCQFINNHTQLSSKIKWPNDIYINDKKTAGILIENQIKGNQIEHTVIGIGLNVNQTVFAKHLNNATSLLHNLHPQQAPYNIFDLLQALIAHLNQNYLKLQTQNWPILNNQYAQHLYKINQLQQFSTNPQNPNFEAQITGVSPEGFLTLKTPQQYIQHYAVGEIIWHINP
jgi:BirA family biotin operon repressor/biotin-[acetyl-CoA-carboxylase] ligase